MATCNVNTLLSSGKDFQRLSKHDLQICICQLLCEIKSAGGGGGGGIGSVLNGNVDPVNPPTTSAALYYNKLTGMLFQWNDDTSAWQ